MTSLSDDKQADVIDTFNTTSRYLDDIFNINYVYFDNMVSQTCFSVLSRKVRKPTILYCCPVFVYLSGTACSWL